MKELYIVKDVKITSKKRTIIAKAIVLAESKEEAIQKYTSVSSVLYTLEVSKCGTDVWSY